jgi:tetratricopeptide (TPR) repeat protein
MIQAKKMITSVQDPKTKAMIIGLGLLTLLTIGWFSYKWYSVCRGKRAQQILGECLQEYQIATNSVQPLWSEIHLMNDLGFDQASGSSLQPFFLVMQAQALAHQHKMDEAAELMQKAIEMLDAASPYKNYFALTKSLMQLDATNKDEKAQGFEQLQLLAQDQNNQYRDAAMYHVGDYYFADNNFGKAKEVWQKLVDQKAEFADSPWIELAEQKVATV